MNEFDDELICMPTEWTYHKTKEPKQLTLLNAMEWLSQTARGTKICDEYLKECARITKFVNKKLSITPRQAVLLGLFSEKTSGDDTCTQDDIAQILDCNNFEMLTFRSDIKELARRRFVAKSNNFRGRAFTVTEEFVDAMTNNLDMLPQKRDGLEFQDFFKQMFEIIRVATDDNSNAEREDTLEEIRELMAGNQHLAFVQALEKGPFQDEDNYLCFLYFAHQLVNWDRENVSLQRSNLDDLIEDRYRFGRLCHSIINGDNTLIRDGLLEAVCEDGLMGNTFKLTEKAIKEYLSEFKPLKRSVSEENMLKPDTIVEKKLFYNDDEAGEIARLASVLDEHNYRDVCDRLEQSGMRRGICVLLSGGPGTGKTETVLQLARQTGRPIIQLNVNDIMDKFVGESEKRAVNVFNRYREAVKNCDVAPILFLNECDQLLGRRIENCRNSVDQMANSLQNIFLQQMETLDGILICTTNLVQNLDSAFERRFLFKIDFKKPTKEARCNIWKSMLPTLSEEEAAQLSEAYDFSGGQIENISRMALIDMALTGVEKPTIEQYIDYCNHEHYSKNSEHRRVGF